MSVFIKENFIDNDSLIKEVEALKLLKKTLDDSNNSLIKIPKIYNFDKKHIEMEKINQSLPSKKLQESFALGLAKLHSIKQKEYGFYDDNYIGLNIQKNILSENWGEFFYKYRLLYQINLIKDLEIKEHFLATLENLKNRLIDFLNENISYASLVHGDLWSGNVLYSNTDVYLIDPAIYYGDSEVDIAMTEMFGGFKNEFYLTYKKEKPLSQNYEKKKIIYNLYHFLNHYNIFGSSYLSTSVSYLEFIKSSNLKSY